MLCCITVLLVQAEDDGGDGGEEKQEDDDGNASLPPPSGSCLPSIDSFLTRFLRLLTGGGDQWGRFGINRGPAVVVKKRKTKGALVPFDSVGPVILTRS